MERLAIKVPLLAISLASTVYWAQPPHFTGGLELAGVCAVWTALTLASFRWGKAEDWSYRLSSFCGVSLATIEGVSVLLALQERPGLFLMALLHGAAFIWAVVGRYQKVAQRRPNRL